MMIQNDRGINLSWLTIPITMLVVALMWLGVLPGLLSSNGFIPHGHCYLWKPELVWLHVTSDLLIGISYVAISATLVYLLAQTRREIPFHWMILAFGLFIVACGATHFMEVLTLWHPVYWLSGNIKVITAIASVTTGLALPPLVPQTRRLLQAAKTSEERRQQLETANQELEALYQKVKELDQTKTQFFANVSHELRTPLALILGPTERLLAIDFLPEESRRSLEMIDRNARILLNQVNDLLELSKLEVGRVRMHYSDVDLAHLVRLTTAHFETLATDRQITYEVETPPVLPVQVDSEKLQRVLLNLLSNAFKFTPRGGRIRCVLEGNTSIAATEFDTAAAPSVSATDNQVTFAIHDSGPGVPTELQEVIFNRFYTKQGGKTSRFGSTGLGLAIVKELVELHGGQVGVTNATTGGACFKVELPVKAPAGVEVPTTPVNDPEGLDIGSVLSEIESSNSLTFVQPALPVAAQSDSQPLVLVVEDNPDMNWFITQTLLAEYRIASAQDGQEGLELAIALQPDLILSDVMMPRMDGEQLVHQLRNHPELSEIPVILLTAKTDTNLEVTLLRQGAQDYLTKPFSAQELCARVGNLVTMQRTRQVLRKELASQGQDVVTLAKELAQQKQELQTTLDALRVSESRFRQILDSNMIGIGFWEREGAITEANDALLQLIGYAREDLTSGLINWQDLTPPEYQALDQQALVEIERIGSCAPFEKEYVRKDGTQVPVLIGGAAFEGCRDRGVFFVLDQTQRKQAETALRESEDRFRRAIVDAPIPVIIHAEDGAIVSLSNTWMELTGYSQAELPTVSAWTERAYGVRQAPIEAGIQSLYELEGRLEEGEFVITTASGEQRTWDFSSAPLGQLPDGRRLVISMARDVTDRKQLEAALRQKAEELAQVNRMKDEFLATLSHELRTPLNSILGWAKLLQTRQFDPETISRALETIERNARLQSQLVEDLLEISRIIQGKLRLQTRPLNLIPVIDAALDAVRLTAEAKAIHLEFNSDHAATNAQWQLLADPDRIQQVVWNLLSNAIKFTPEGGRVDVRVQRVNLENSQPSHSTIYCSGGLSSNASEWVQIIVSDTGIGIHPDLLPHVFDRFRQGDSSTTRSYSGLGLGLAIVRHLTEQHGGTVWAESRGEDQGSTFVVQLPLIQSEGVDSTQNGQYIPPSQLSSASTLPLAGLSAIVVDDDTDTREFLTTALQHYGMNVTAISSVRQALYTIARSKLSGKQPDILVSDIGLPEEDGYALIRQLRQMEPAQGGQIPAIALTAYAAEEDSNQAILAGFQLHLPKPIEPTDLVAAIATLTGRVFRPK